MQIKLIRNDSAPEAVVKQILKNLETGIMKPGQKLPTQEKLAERFGVGRSSIREATNALAIMGYLKIIQGKGTFISEKPPDDNSQATSDRDFIGNGNLLDTSANALKKTAQVNAELQSTSAYSKTPRQI